MAKTLYLTQIEMSVWSDADPDAMTLCDLMRLACENRAIIADSVRRSVATDTPEEFREWDVDMAPHFGMKGRE